ncbi:Crp/Fnr family transcriptional regulator [Photobacterium sp. DNB22_13_2]
MKETLQQIYGLSDDLTNQLVQAGTFRTFQRGKYLGFQNEIPQVLYLPLGGIISLQAPCESRDDFFYAIFSAGIPVNDMFLLCPQPRLESLKALSDVTLLSIPFSRSREIMVGSVEFSQFLMSSVSLKLYTVSSLNYIHSEKNPEKKVLKCLEHLAKLNPSNKVYLNYRNIASLMVISRNTVAKVVKDLQRRGVLLVEKTHITFPAGGVSCNMKIEQN